ncbi:MAG: hypothetical protein LBV22_00550 [Mycoplasmataceae bacterium]|nr:hypothetical protein [Mycoplasmataceae bacterium]
MNTISSKLAKMASAKKPVVNTSLRTPATPVKKPLNSMSAAKVAKDKAAMNKKPTQKFIGFGSKAGIANNLGLTDVASKLEDSDTYGLSAEHLIERSESDINQHTAYNPFLKRENTQVVFARGTTEEEKQAYLQTQQQQTQLNDGSSTNFSNYTELKKDDSHAGEKIADKKVKLTADLFKKRS